MAKKTNLIFVNGNSCYQIQVKSTGSSDEAVMVENKWRDSNIDYVVYSSRNEEWGYMTPVFQQCRKHMNSSDHIQFHNN